MTPSDDILARVQLDMQVARNKVSNLEAQLGAACAELADLEGFVRTFERYASPARGNAAQEPMGEPRKNKDRGVPVEGSQARKLVDNCILAITANGRPMKIGELLDVALASGLAIGGRDQKSNLAGYLSRDPRVYSRGRSVGWDIVKTEEAALEPASGEVASSNMTGGTDERFTLVSSEFGGLPRPSISQVP